MSETADSAKKSSTPRILHPLGASSLGQKIAANSMTSDQDLKSLGISETFTSELLIGSGDLSIP
jgi:hypothetical protein